jgi:alpha-L-fucosidase
MAYKQTFRPTLESVRKHRLPRWYDDAKLGIFIHWGLYSVPAFAPPSYELGEVPGDETWFCNNPYAEWYQNSIRVRRGPTWEHHLKKYGADFEYNRFAGLWKAEAWDPGRWAELFKKAGAGYVVLTTKHHDGYCLWPSKYTEFNSLRQGPRRDILGDLSRAVRQAGLRMGTYYSGMLDWTQSNEPIFDETGLRNLYPNTYAYADYAYLQSMELIDRYEPSIFWNDIGWPKKGEADLPHLLSHYYNTVEEGVVNDRWNDVWCDFTTKEYKAGEMTLEHKWEMCRGLGLSFGYNAEEGEDKTLSAAGLISLLVTTVASNGNLLINVGPKADGTIAPIQERLLLALGGWLTRFGEAVYGTRPHTAPSADCQGTRVHFTRKGDALYLIPDALRPGPLAFEAAGLPAHARAELLAGVSGQVTTTGDKVVVRAEVPEGLTAFVVKVSGLRGA